MTEKVTDICTRQPHMSGTGYCLNCYHTWEAIAEIGVCALECPKCGTCKGVWRGIMLPEGPLWECKCGCMHFFISGYYAHCCHCGLTHEPWRPIDGEG